MYVWHDNNKKEKKNKQKKGMWIQCNGITEKIITETTRTNYSSLITYKLRGGTNNDNPVLWTAANLHNFAFG